MSKISKSPERHTFQKQGYIDRQTEKGEPVNEDYLEMFEKILEREEHKFDEPESRVDNLEWDLRTTEWILAKARASDSYAQNIYAALCNTEWQRLDVFPILKDQRWSCSWRYAGGIVADMLEKGDYIDWYCSGMGGLNQEYDAKETNEEWQKRTGYVPESVVTDEIRADFQKLGWILVPEKDDKDLTL